MTFGKFLSIVLFVIAVFQPKDSVAMEDLIFSIKGNLPDKVKINHIDFKASNSDKSLTPSYWEKGVKGSGLFHITVEDPEKQQADNFQFHITSKGKKHYWLFRTSCGF